MIRPGIDAEAASPPPFLPLPIRSTTSRYDGPEPIKLGVEDECHRARSTRRNELNAHAVRPVEDWRSGASQPHSHGAVDAQPVDRSGARSERDDARLLRAARVRRPHPFRGDLRRARRRRLSAYAGRLVRRAGRGLAQRRRGRACRRRAHLPPALARRAHLRSDLPGRRAAGCARARSRPRAM